MDAGALRGRFLAVALARPEPFPEAQTSQFLARLRDASDGEGFSLLRLPRLPAVVPQLLQALREDKAGMAAVAELAARDPLIAGGIVRVANSAWYGGEPLTSLSQAVVRLGRDAVREVVLRTALRPIHPAAPGTPVHAAGERLWTHAQCCGIACASMGHGFDGMLAGLAGATGASAALALLAQSEPELLHADAVHAAFARAMWRIAARAAQAWDLPGAVVAALHDHAGAEARGGLGRGLAQAERLSMQYLLRRWEDPALVPSLQGGAEAVAWAALERHHPDD
ncbi:MAG TPA: HDOD domain-containing protein [Xanthomonadaceae bacterium]|nr:HDOD domain-containing protein [Xanthomonadaceae bacterium]